MLLKTMEELEKKKVKKITDVGPNIYEKTRVFYPELAKEGFLCVSNVDRSEFTQGLLAPQLAGKKDNRTGKPRIYWWNTCYRSMGAQEFTVATGHKAYDQRLIEIPSCCPVFARITHPERLKELTEGL